jgi:signal transduction histidine kinase
VYWIANYFVGKGIGTKQQVGVIAVDITEIKKFDKFVSRLANPFLATQDENTTRQAKEVHDAIAQYFMALTASLGRMTRHIWQLDKSADEQLGPSIELLDRRILRMREFVSELASRFPFR